MMRLMLLTATVLAAVANRGQAQQPYQRPATSPYSKPTVNPILNAFGPRNSAFDYFTQTRPQLETARSIGQLQYGQQLQGQQLAALQPTANLGVPPSLGITGHPVAFFNYSHYYTFPSPRFGPGSTGQGLGAGASAPASSPLNDPYFGQAPRPPGIGIVVPIRIGDGGDK
jgi:hypothetical protein